MHNGSTSSSIPTPPPLPPEGLNNWDPKKNSNTAPQNSGNSTATPKVKHPVQPPSVDHRDELKKKFAKQNQEAADDGKQPEGQTVPTLSPKPIVQKQQDTQSKPQQQQTTEINHSDKDKIITTQPTLENSSMPISVLKADISVPKLSIAICLLFTSNVSAIGCVVATAILYNAAVVPIVPIAIFAISMLVMFASIIYIVYSIKNALKVDLKEHIESKQPESLEKTQQQTPSLAPLAPEENLGNVVDPSKPTPPPIISPESGGASQPPTLSSPIANHSSGGAPPPPPPPISNHSSSNAPPLSSNGPSKPGNNMGNGDARGMMLSLIKSGVSLKKTEKGTELFGQTKSDEKKPKTAKVQSGVSLKETEKGAELLGQTKSDKEKPKTAEKLKSNNNFITDVLKRRFAVMYTLEDDEDDSSERSLHNEDSDHEDDWIYDNQSNKVRVFYDTSGQLNSQARFQPSTNNKPPKPQVPEKPLHLQSNPQASTAKKENNAAPVNASIDQTQVSFVESRSKFFENQW